jgi:hypothetical protein
MVRQMSDYLQDRTRYINFRKLPTIELLNGRLDLASCIRWEDHLTNLIDDCSLASEKVESSGIVKVYGRLE